MIRKIVKYILIGTATLLGLFIATATFLYFKNVPTFLDEPKNLSGQIQTIEVYYVAWACDCPDWVETKYEKANRNYEIDEKDCIYITPTSEKVKIPDSFYFDHFGKRVQLVGQFYTDKGIPTSYEMKTDEKPDKAKVFRYDKFKIIKSED
jgi:hypothetical protein